MLAVCPARFRCALSLDYVRQFSPKPGLFIYLSSFQWWGKWGAQQLGADTILSGEESKLFAVTIIPVGFKVLFAFSKCKHFFFSQVRCWMPKSPYSPALQTEMGWTGLLVYRAGPENTSAIRGRSVSRKKRSFWVSRVQWLPLCRGYSQLWTECAVISKAFWPRSSEAQVSWSHLRAASQERHLLQGEKSGLREMRDMPVSTQLDHDQVGNQNLRFLTPLFFLINSWIHLQNMTCVMIGSEEEHECKIWLWGIYLRLFCIWNPFLSIMWLDLRGSDGVESFRPLQVPVCARQWDISKSFLLD